MTSLVCVGLGYSAAHYVAAHGKRFDRIVGTARSRGRNPDVVVFDGRAASPAFLADIRECDALLISAPPDDRGDPVLACCADAIATSKRLRAIVYLSSVGVYGDHDGAWVDETSAPRAASPRAKARLKAEAAWRDIAA